MLEHPLLALAVALAALALRLAVPAGYMPVLDQGRLALTLCSDTAVPTASAPSHHPGSPAPGTHPENGVPAAGSDCAFADLALPVVGGADPIQLTVALVFILAAGLSFSAALPPHSALRLRPPLRGPPLPA